MKQIDSIAGKCYIATAPNGGTVTDEAGRTLATVEAGEQKAVWGTDGKLYLSDDDGKLVLATFNYALAVAGLLGGGADKLPAGYTRLEFLEISGYAMAESARVMPYISLQMPTLASDDKWEVSTVHAVNFSTGVAQVEGVNAHGVVHSLFYGANAAKKFYAGSGNGASAVSSLIVDNQKHTFAFGQKWNQQYASFDGEELSVAQPTTIFNPKIGVFVALKAGSAGYNYPFNGKKYNWKFVKNEKKIYDLIPALDKSGEPCMFDRVSKQAFRNAGSGQFVAGFTLAQARKLGKLPAGTILTVSLPVGYDSDSGVVAALAEAEANGCVLTVQTYEVASAVSTFALRRVWVRRQQAEHGSYVAADGSRWLVDWCVDIIGADPETLGYERYRSVDAAVGYWGLVPYEHPEEELSNEA